MLHTHITTKPIDIAAQCAVKERTVAERMADIMIDKAGIGCNLSHFIDGGISASDVEAHIGAARKLAADRFVRHDDTPAYDRVARVSEAAQSILCLMPETLTITMHLMARGFSKAEMDNLLAEAIATAADEFAHSTGATQ